MSAHPYQFVILRYTPNLAREEFTNLGIVMFRTHVGDIRYKLLTPMSPNIPAIPGMLRKEVKVFLEGINYHFESVTENLEELCLEQFDRYPVDLGSIEPILKLLKRQDATLSWSEVKVGIHFDPFERIDPLFLELIEPVPILFDSKELPPKP